MVVLINSGGEKAIILADAVAHPAQVSEPGWEMVLDHDRQEAIATRKQLLDQIEAEGRTLIQCHFPSPGYGRIVRVEGRRYWQALTPAEMLGRGWSGLRPAPTSDSGADFKEVATRPAPA